MDRTKGFRNHRSEGFEPGIGYMFLHFIPATIAKSTYLLKSTFNFKLFRDYHLQNQTNRQVAVSNPSINYVLLNFIPKFIPI